MIKAKSLTRTCEAFPSQWEGFTIDGKFIYVRYRSGILRISIADTEDAAVLGVGSNSANFVMEFGDEYGGRISVEELIKISDDSINYDECEFSEEDEKFYVYSIPFERQSTGYELLEINPLKVGEEKICPTDGAVEMTADKERYICDDNRMLLVDYIEKHKS